MDWFSGGSDNIRRKASDWPDIGNNRFFHPASMFDQSAPDEFGFRPETMFVRIDPIPHNDMTNALLSSNV
jgi:hypothetical protein